VGKGRGEGRLHTCSLQVRNTTINLGKALLQRVPSLQRVLSSKTIGISIVSKSIAESIVIFAHRRGHWLVEVHRLARQLHHQRSVLDRLCMR